MMNTKPTTTKPQFSPKGVRIQSNFRAGVGVGAMSDRRVKANIVAVDPQAVLQTVVEVTNICK